MSTGGARAGICCRRARRGVEEHVSGARLSIGVGLG